MNLSRLLIVVEPGKDGVFDYVCSLVDHLIRHHPEVVIDLAYSSVRSCPELWDLVARVEAHGGETADMKVSNAPQVGDIRACFQIQKLVWRRRPQVVHAHSSKAGGLCRVLRGLHRIFGVFWPRFPRMMYTPHAYYGLEGQKSATAFFFNSLEKFLGPIGFTTTCSSDERAFGLETLRVPRRRLILVNHGIDVGRYHPPTPLEKKLSRAEFGFPDDVPVLLSVGRDSYQKNYPPLYRALEKVLSDPSTRFVFAHAGAGSAELGAKLSDAARKRFYSFSYVSALERLMAASDGFILTSRYEGLSLSVLISIACGLKMFLTTAPGNICLKRIGFESISWIDSAKDSDGMAEEIERSLRAWDAHPDFSAEEQVDLAQKCFNRDVQLEKICRIYDHLAKEDGSVLEDDDPRFLKKEKL